MDIYEFRKTDNDRYGREYPVKIVMKNGETVIGHIVVISHAGDDFTIEVFKQIENMDDWKSNRIDLGTKVISIRKEEISDISVYMDY